ncbi:MAG: Eco57I restriction-modification methylase domain-containing protein, partial [Leptospiraceae bacterium]|nr:Eco57I restriction-modification methylase domain-containing protein [Leptospiraceae bacterium]
PLTPDGNLSTNEKIRILLNTIYCVDIYANSVEVTKLSLLLKCLEGETEASIEQQLKLFNEKVLPDIDENIKCGNSLVDMDYIQLFGKEDIKKIKPFHWEVGFPEILREGGFDVIIGNPPYVMLQNLSTKKIFSYALQKFSSARYKIDTYQLFIEKAISLLKNSGVLGLITPNTYLKNIHSEPLRQFILERTSILQIVLFQHSVFSQASVDTCISIFQKKVSEKDHKFRVYISDFPFSFKPVNKVKQSLFLKNKHFDFDLLVSNQDNNILKKISKLSKSLETYCNAYFGIQTFSREKYVSKTKKNSKYQPVIDGENIEAYKLKPVSEFVYFIPSAIKSGGNEEVYKKERICVRQIGFYPIATLVPANIFTLNTVYNLYLKDASTLNLKFLLGIINSKLVKYFWKKKNSDEKKQFPKIKKEALLSLPIPVIDFQNKVQKTKHDTIVKYVEEILSLYEEKNQVQVPHVLSQLQQKIDYYEKSINEIVYEIYGLTKEEIQIVETEF